MGGVVSLFGGFVWFGGKGLNGEEAMGILELFETGVEDVEIVGDLFFPLVKRGVWVCGLWLSRSLT